MNKIKFAQQVHLDILCKINNKRKGCLSLKEPYKIRTFHSGNYIVALINEKYIGVAKFNPNDYKFDLIGGTKRAIARAVKHRVHKELRT